MFGFADLPDTAFNSTAFLRENKVDATAFHSRLNNKPNLVCLS